MLYLLDANILIMANRQYYPIDQVPEFWEWLVFHGKAGRVKIPIEIIEEVLVGPREGDPLVNWTKDAGVSAALTLQEQVNPRLLRKVLSEGYAPDVTDDEIEQCGRDPFLVAYALADAGRCVISNETSIPNRLRQNRKVPDVCRGFSVPCEDIYTLNRALKFSTSWKKSPPGC